MPSTQQGSSAPIAIVGIGCLFPKADHTGGFWANVRHGVDAITPVPPSHWNPDDYFNADPKVPDMTYARMGGFLPPVDFAPLDFGIAPNDIEATDTAQLLGLVAAKQALKDAGYDDKPLDRSRVSVILGVTGTLELVIPLGARLGHPKWRKALKDAGVDATTSEDVVNRISEQYVPWQENSFPGLLGNVVAGRIANRLDLGGTNCVVDAACASSLSAVHLAALELAAGRSDVVVSGGVDTFNDIFMYMCFSKTPALSPTGQSRPFERDGDGTILGEGLGIVVLKRLEDAERDGDRIYAVIKSVGSSSDGKGGAIYAPVAAGQVRALKNAYSLAGVSTDTVELVEGHGTGTKVGDATEVKALTQVYLEGHMPAEPGAPVASIPSRVALGSVKSQIGHTKAAAGAAGLIKAALALYYKTLPPTIKVSHPLDVVAPGASPFYVNLEARPWIPGGDHPRRAGLSAFGFGGSNFHAVLEEYGSAKTETDWDGRVQIVALSGGSPGELRERLRTLSILTRTELDRAAILSRQPGQFSASAPCRLLIVLNEADPAKVLGSADRMLETVGAATFQHTPEGAFYGSGPAVGGVGVLFPGQGAQYVGMLRDLAVLFPEMLDALSQAEKADKDANTTHHGRLSEKLYPHAAFDTKERVRQESELRQTEHAQPALGAVSFGAWSVMSNTFGVKADAFGGHSYGELPALCAAGVIEPATMYRLSRLRGSLMAQTREGDAGAMLAVMAPREAVDAFVRDEALNLVIANRNAPEQFVLSGATSEIDRAEKQAALKGLRTARLPVAAAFHSPLVRGALKPFADALEGVHFAPAKTPIWSNTTAKPWPTAEGDIRRRLAEQLGEPVEFIGQIAGMVESGIRTFVEVGPGNVLSRLTAKIAETLPFKYQIDTVALDASSGKRPGTYDLALLLARLAARGHGVDLGAWEEGSRFVPPEIRRGGFTVPLTGANYVKPRPPLPPTTRTVPAPTNPTTSVTPAKRATATSPSSTMNDSTRPPSDPQAVSAALSMTQQSLQAFARLQEQTASLHKQFLEQQETAQRTLQMLVAQQSAIAGGGVSHAMPMPLPMPAATPAFVPMPAFVPVPQPVPMPQAMPAAMKPAPVPVQAPVAPSKPVPAPVVKAPASGRAQSVLMSVISEKTGYPTEMLSPEMTLDADLGIDSIKRVEILSALQEKLPDAPPVKPEHLGTLHTLNDIVQFLESGATRNGTHAPAPVSVPVTASPVPVPVAPPAAKPSAGGDIEAVLLAVVSEKTGYPVEMLSPEMSLDADLGIDSIKRVEILSALQEKLPNAPAVKPEHLGTLHTLADIGVFLRGPSAVASAPANGNGSHPGKARAGSHPEPRIVAGQPARAVAEAPLPSAPANRLERLERSVPHAVPLPADARRKLSLPPGSNIWLISEPFSLMARISSQISSMGYKPIHIGWNDSAYAYDSRNVGGVVIFAPEKRVTDDFALAAFRWIKQASVGLQAAARVGGSFLATVSRIDGAFGFGSPDPLGDPLPGSLAGLLKTAAIEWPAVSCKAIDLDPSDMRAIEKPLMEELFTEGPLEVGIRPEGRYTLELVPTKIPDRPETPFFHSGDVIVVSGGARGVTASCALAIAELSQPAVVLLGRTAPPEPEPTWMAPLKDENEIRAAIASRADGSKTPKQIGEAAKAALAQREIRDSIGRLEMTGARVAYMPVDVLDAGSVRRALGKVREQFGAITGLIHGAGVLNDRKLEDLSEEKFTEVYRTKVVGLKTMLGELQSDPLRALVLFSSSTARFGRMGQIAYAAANEALNKIAQLYSRQKPGVRTVAINWGPWEGGMVTDSLAKIFRAEGIDLIGRDDGAELLIRELSAADRPAEIVVLSRIDPSTGQVPFGATGSAPVRFGAPLPTSPMGGSGLFPTPLPAAQPGSGLHPVRPEPLAADMTQAFERKVSLAEHPVLRSHVFDHRAMVPFALQIEWLAHAAMHGNPGYSFVGLNDARVISGIVAEDAAPPTIRAMAGKPTRKDGILIVPTELRGQRLNREMVHSRADVLLSSVAAVAESPAPPPDVDPIAWTPDEIYRQYLFHGSDLQAIQAVEGCGSEGIIVRVRTAPAPSSWMNHPLRSSWLADPMVLDAAFQAMIVWSFLVRGSGSLPVHLGKYRQYRRNFPSSGSLRVSASITSGDTDTIRAKIDFLDSTGTLYARMTDYSFVIKTDLAAKFRKNQLLLVK